MAMQYGNAVASYVVSECLLACPNGRPDLPDSQEPEVTAEPVAAYIRGLLSQLGLLRFLS
jgi:hypothetical protein